MPIKPQLTTFDTTMIVVSLVIGIGIFRTPAMVAQSAGTPYLFFAAWILGGLISLLGALTFAEIGARFPHPGSFYKVVADCYGSAPALVLNWASVIIVNGAGAAAVAIIGAEYLNPIVLPRSLQSQTAVLLTAAAMIVVLILINYLGIKTGAWAQNILTLFKIGMIALMVFAAFRTGGGPMENALPTSSAKPWWFALAVALISVFYTYGGYQLTINFGADVQAARRNIPRAIVFGILIVIACYLAINFAYIRVLGLTGVAGAKLVAAETAKAVFGKFGYFFVSMTIFFSSLGFLNVTLMQIPRTLYAMAADRVLPRTFMSVNPRTQTQEFALLFFGAMILVSLVLLGTFENIVNYVMFIDSLNIAVVASTIFVLRRKASRNGLPYDGFKAPLFPFLPALFTVFLLGISVNVLLTQTREALLGAAFSMTGLPFFWLMRKINKNRGPD